MRIYSRMVPAMASEIIKALLENNDIEVEADNREGAEGDIASIINEFKRQDDEITDAARDMLARRGWNSSKLSEAKRMMASSQKFPANDDDALDYIINQMLEFMMISNNIEEVFAADNVLRKRIVVIIRRHLNIDDEVDAEVRKRLKHLQEGTRDWEIQYSKTAEQVRRNKGLI